MKKILAVIFSVFLGLSVYAQSTDSSVYNELISAFNTEFYPGVVEKAGILEKNFPNSPYILQSSFLKAQAYYYLYDYSSAISGFEKVLPFLEPESDDYLKANYLEGRCFFAQKNYEKAVSRFYISCKGDYYNQSVCLASQCYYLLGDYKKAAPLFEYIIENGNKYSAEDYSICAVQLIGCYKANGDVKKAESLFKSLDKSDSVLSKADDLKWNFYVQLGIDNFNQKDYESAESYFGKAAKLIESGFVQDDTILHIYNLKIRIEKCCLNNKKDELKEIETELVNLEPEVKQSVYEGIADSYYSTLLKVQILNGNWDSVTKLYGKIQSPSVEADYLVAAYYYNNSDFKNAQKYLSKYNSLDVNPENLSNMELLASVYAKTQNFSAAEDVYRKIENAGLLASKTRFEYAKVLFINKKFNKSYEMSFASKENQRDYLCALNRINLQDWNGAKKHLISYISGNGTKSDFNNLSVFYKGYVEYVLEDYKNAYISFVRFSAFAKDFDPKYTKQTYEYGAKSALQNGDYKAASILAESLIKATSGQQKEEALIFCADIYSDCNEFEKAVNVLKPYTNDKSDFSVKALFQIAKIYEKNNQISDAEKTYQKVISDFPKSSYAEEAMYNCGELYYLIQDYSTAEKRFNSYISKYLNGKFAESALFFCGDCDLKISDFDKSITYNLSLLKKFPESIYVYGACKNLIQSYYEIEDYEDALKYAQKSETQFPTQAAEDGIGRRMLELQKIVSGVDSTLAKKLTEFENAGKTGTVRGRAIGSEIVRLYAQNPETEKDGIMLAEQILAKQTQNEEKKSAAENAEFLADYYRKNYENKKAAQLYLKAAEYYRSSLDSDPNDAAAVLYSAVDAFKADGSSGDAEETAKLLKKLYPDSRYAVNVDNLLK